MRGQVLRSLTDARVVIERRRVNKVLSDRHVHELLEQVAKRVTRRKENQWKSQIPTA